MPYIYFSKGAMKKILKLSLCVAEIRIKIGSAILLSVQEQNGEL